MKIPALITKILTDYFRWIGLGLVIIILALGYVLIIGPKLQSIQSSQVSQQKTNEAELKSKQEYIAELKASNSSFATKIPEARRQEIDDFIPSTADFPGLILTVKNIVTQSQLSLNNITVSQGGVVPVTAGAATPATAIGKADPAPSAQAATVSGINVKTQDVAITVSGGTSYAGLKAFLTTIESSRRLFDVVSFNFTTPTAAVAGPTATAATSSWTLSLRSYYLPSS